MRTLVQRLKRLWNTPVEFYGVDRPEPQAGSWHGLLLFVILLVVLGLLWLIRYLPERTVLVHVYPPETRSRVAQAARSSGGCIPGPPSRGKHGQDLLGHRRCWWHGLIGDGQGTAALPCGQGLVGRPSHPGHSHSALDGTCRTRWQPSCRR
jgi:hypothetical protein